MSQYTNNTPQGSQQIATTQPLLLGNTAYVQDVVGKDHNFSLNSTNPTDGYHTIAHFVTQGADPTAISGVMQAYTVVDSGQPQLRVMDGAGTVSKLTGTVNAVNGYQWIGAVLLQWGRVTASTGNSGTTNYNIPFANNCWNVSTTSFYTGGIPSTPATALVASNGSTVPSKTLFNWTFTGSNTANGFFWLAIGN